MKALNKIVLDKKTGLTLQDVLAFSVLAGMMYWLIFIRH